MNKFFKLASVMIVVGALASGCASFTKPKLEKPEIKILATELVGLTFDEAQMEIALEIFNPNKITLNLGELNYQLAIEGQQILIGKQTQATKLKAGKSQQVVLPFAVNFVQLAQLVKNLTKLNAVDYQVTGGVAYKLPVLGTQEKSFITGGSLPVPSLPRVEFGGIKKQHLSLNGLGVLVALKVYNPNVFDLNLNQLKYSLNLANKQLTTGGQVQQLNLAAGQTSALELPLEVKFNAKQGMQLVNLLTKGEGLDYQVEVSSELASSLKALEGLPFKTAKVGKLKF